MISLARITLPAVLFLLLRLSLFAADESATPASQVQEMAAPDFVLVGDSTVTVEKGWGSGFTRLLREKVSCVNAAQSGRSSKSFRDEGHWSKALALRGKYYLIQFGHNDQPGKGPARETDAGTTFRENLTRFVNEVRAQGGQVVLITSLTRRDFDPEAPAKIKTTLAPYAVATLAVAEAMHVPAIDLHRLSIAHCEMLGPVKTAAYNFIDDKGKNDTTHLKSEGSDVFARIVVRELVRLLPELRTRFLEDPAGRDL